MRSRLQQAHVKLEGGSINEKGYEILIKGRWKEETPPRVNDNAEVHGFGETD